MEMYKMRLWEFDLGYPLYYIRKNLVFVGKT